jgi:hypothetical protein
MCDCEPTTIEQAPAAEQIQELTAEVEWLRQQLSSAQRTVDVERLVEALTSFVTGSDARRLEWHDPRLAEAYRAAGQTAMDQGIDFELAQRAGFRALVLAALGMEVHRGEQEAPTTATC